MQVIGPPDQDSSFYHFGRDHQERIPPSHDSIHKCNQHTKHVEGVFTTAPAQFEPAAPIISMPIPHLLGNDVNVSIS
jgi:hypothetical protein